MPVNDADDAFVICEKAVNVRIPQFHTDAVNLFAICHKPKKMAVALSPDQELVSIFLNKITFTDVNTYFLV